MILDSNQALHFAQVTVFVEAAAAVEVVAAAAVAATELICKREFGSFHFNCLQLNGI